jgi:hypothetical protein
MPNTDAQNVQRNVYKEKVKYQAIGLRQHY